jgi:hypothetical protein
VKKPTCRLVALIILGIVTVQLAFVGCAAVQRAAEDVQYVAGGRATPSGESTTQPSTRPTNAALKGARAAADVARAASPAISGILTTVSLISGAVAGIAGAMAGKKSGQTQARKQAHTVIAEIVDDVAAFKRPEQPWTESTRKLLTDLGYVDEAQHVETLATIADFTNVPTMGTPAPPSKSSS